jgi:hypothetical protein
MDKKDFIFMKRKRGEKNTKEKDHWLHHQMTGR